MAERNDKEGKKSLLKPAHIRALRQQIFLSPLPPDIASAEESAHLINLNNGPPVTPAVERQVNKRLRALRPWRCRLALCQQYHKETVGPVCPVTETPSCSRNVVADNKTSTLEIVKLFVLPAQFRPRLKVRIKVQSLLPCVGRLQRLF